VQHTAEVTNTNTHLTYPRR